MRADVALCVLTVQIVCCVVPVPRVDTSYLKSPLRALSSNI